MEKQIVAQRDKSTFLVQVGENQGQVLDIFSKVMFPPMHIDAILGKGYWEEYTGDLNLEELLVDIKELTEEDLLHDSTGATE